MGLAVKPVRWHRPPEGSTCRLSPVGRAASEPRPSRLRFQGYVSTSAGLPKCASRALGRFRKRCSVWVGLFLGGVKFF